MRPHHTVIVFFFIALSCLMLSLGTSDLLRSELLQAAGIFSLLLLNREINESGMNGQV